MSHCCVWKGDQKVPSSPGFATELNACLCAICTFICDIGLSFWTIVCVQVHMCICAVCHGGSGCNVHHGWLWQESFASF